MYSPEEHTYPSIMDSESFFQGTTAHWPKNKNKWSRYGYRKWSHAGSKEVYKDTQKQGPASELVLSSMETEDVATVLNRQNQGSQNFFQQTWNEGSQTCNKRKIQRILLPS